jgi:antitoxin (DNA-binding transcriptional repressor) of toxin-antitoxin stability system
MSELKKLLSAVAHGENVVIIGADGAAFQLLALPRRPKPVFGSARGLVHMGPEFDEPVEWANKLEDTE